MHGRYNFLAHRPAESPMNHDTSKKTALRFAVRMYKLLLLALLFNPFTINAHSLTTGTPFENGLSHFREGDFESAYAEWLEGAEQGDAGAQFGLGLMYYSGQGIKQDYSSAFEWMK